MSDSELQPGDAVVDLAASARSAGVASGLISAGVSAWFLDQSALIIFISIVAGGAIGYLIGFIIGRIIFPCKSGDTVIVKVGMSSLPSTLKAAFPTSIITVSIISVALAMLTGNTVSPCIYWSLGIGAILGVICPCLSSLT